MKKAKNYVNNSYNEIDLSLSNNVHICFDVSKPGALMTDFNLYFPSKKSKRNEVINKMAIRLLNSIQLYKKKLTIELDKTVSGYKNWLYRHKKKVVLKRKLKKLYSKLSEWLTYTLCVLGNKISVKVIDSKPLV